MKLPPLLVTKMPSEACSMSSRNLTSLSRRASSAIRRERRASAELRHGEIRDDEMGLELVQLAPKVRFGLNPAALEIQAAAFQLPQHQLGVGFAVLREQYPELLGHELFLGGIRKMFGKNEEFHCELYSPNASGLQGTLA